MVANTIDEDYKLGERTNMEAINHFNIRIWTWFKSTYLEQPIELSSQSNKQLMKQKIVVICLDPFATYISNGIIVLLSQP
jgi:hypothetical protein